MNGTLYQITYDRNEKFLNQEDLEKEFSENRESYHLFRIVSDGSFHINAAERRKEDLDWLKMAFKGIFEFEEMSDETLKMTMTDGGYQRFMSQWRGKILAKINEGIKIYDMNDNEQADMFINSLRTLLNNPYDADRAFIWKDKDCLNTQTLYDFTNYELWYIKPGKPFYIKSTFNYHL